MSAIAECASITPGRRAAAFDRLAGSSYADRLTQGLRLAMVQAAARVWGIDRSWPVLRVLLPWIALASAAQGQYSFRGWTVDDGLPQNSVRDILQTRDSYLWLATLDGLVRFDGVRFTTFSKANSPGISGNRFTILFQDRGGDLWIGSESFVTRLHGGVFTSYGAESGLPRGWVRGITTDSAGNVLLLFPDCVMRWRNGRFERLNTGPFPNDLMDFPVIHHPSTGFWSQSPHGLAAYVDGKVTLWNPRPGNFDVKAHAVAQDERGTIWVGGAGKLFRDENGKLVRVPLPSACLASQDFAFITAPKLKLVCRGVKSTLIVSTPDGGEQQVLDNSPLPLFQQLSHIVFYEDREGILCRRRMAQPSSIPPRSQSIQILLR